jgi:hypothetical protein
VVICVSHPPVHPGPPKKTILPIIIPGENRRFLIIGDEHLMVVAKKTPDAKKIEPKKMEPKKADLKKMESKKPEVKTAVAKPAAKPVTKAKK